MNIIPEYQYNESNTNLALKYHIMGENEIFGKSEVQDLRLRGLILNADWSIGIFKNSKTEKNRTSHGSPQLFIFPNWNWRSDYPEIVIESFQARSDKTAVALSHVNKLNYFHPQIWFIFYDRIKN